MKIVRTKTSDGIHFSGLLVTPNQKSDTVIIHIHGMSGDFYTNKFLATMYEEYPKNNIAFMAGENRGTHTILEMKTDQGVKYYGNAYEVFEDCVKDIQAWVDLAKSLGYTNIWLQGHSLGPSKIVYYLSQIKDPEIKGLILISPSDMIGLVHTKAGQKDYDLLYPEAQQLINDGKSNQLLSNFLLEDVKVSASTFINFFEEPANTAIFNYARPDLGWDKINEIKIPVLAITGTNDYGIVSVIEANQAMSLLQSNLKQSPKVKTVVYENADHSFDGFGDQIVSEVLNFIKS